MTSAYLASYLGNARVAGLQADLGLTDRQYQICVTVLYVYVPAFVTPCACFSSSTLMQPVHRRRAAFQSTHAEDRPECHDAYDFDNMGDGLRPSGCCQVIRGTGHHSSILGSDRRADVPWYCSLPIRLLHAQRAVAPVCALLSHW